MQPEKLVNGIWFTTRTLRLEGFCTATDCWGAKICAGQLGGCAHCRLVKVFPVALPTATVCNMLFGSVATAVSELDQS